MVDLWTPDALVLFPPEVARARLARQWISAGARVEAENSLPIPRPFEAMVVRGFDCTRGLGRPLLLMPSRSGGYLVEARPHGYRREAERSVHFADKCYVPERSCGQGDLITYDATQMATCLHLRATIAIPNAVDARDTAS